MKWAMYLKTDAVLTNDPVKYIALRDHVPSKNDAPESWPYRDFFTLYALSWMGYFLMTLRVWRFAIRSEFHAKMEKVEEKMANGGLTEKIQEIDA